jgi:hypothetical protein
MQVRADTIKQGSSSCGCGRSPTGQCIGWHGLTEEQYWDQLKEYNWKSMGDHAGEQFVQDPNLAINICEIYG